jgi:hypothetical protein
MDELALRRRRRIRAVLAIALVAFAAGAIVGAHVSSSPATALATRFVGAWTRSDYAAMYSDLDPSSRGSISPSSFAGELAGAMRTATATGARIAGRARRRGTEVIVPVRVRTRLFGTLRLDYAVTVDAGGAGGVSWVGSETFPGLRGGERLSRRTTLPRRATIVARDGSVLAESPSGRSSEGGETTRSSPLGEYAKAVLGTIGPVPASRRAALEAEGVPATGPVGLSGLELALDDRLRGRPGGELLAGQRVLASSVPVAAAPVLSSVSPGLQREAVTALGGQLGGIVALAPNSGQILAVAGLGLDGLQPPGSTFKIVTLTGVLTYHVATPSTTFPYATHSTLDGVRLDNANGEECGGTLEQAFAVSCNSVFTPLGVRLGASRLVQTAEAFGFNQDPGIAGAARSTLPAASSIQGELAVGSTAIGQGQVLATPLQMAIVAAAIADGGQRPRPTVLADAPPAAPARATSPEVARTVRRLMLAVVRSGTGTAAAIPGVAVAGKTGTAELKSSCSASSGSGETESGEAGREARRCGEQEPEASNTDAWFTAFAPASHPRIVVCVMLVKDGAGGATAAPVAREVLETGLRGS